jgi:hypothetical protein
MTNAGAASVRAGLSPQLVGQAILTGYDGVVPIQSWGETSIFDKLGLALARGACFCTLKERDGENDRAAALGRPGM